jgi:hypothetical protein
MIATTNSEALGRITAEGLTLRIDSIASELLVTRSALGRGSPEQLRCRGQSAPETPPAQRFRANLPRRFAAVLLVRNFGII